MRKRVVKLFQERDLMTGCRHLLLELTWHFICLCYSDNDNNSSYRSQQTGCWMQPVGGISKDRGGIHGGGELWWSSLLCCSWPRVLSERCVCVSESWREGSMNKAGSVNYSEKCFWMPWGKERAGCVFMCVCVCVCVLGIEATGLDWGRTWIRNLQTRFWEGRGNWLKLSV